MSAKWMGTKHKGVRYYEHTTRKHGVQRDKYFSIRYQRAGQRREEGLGWLSEGWNLDKAVAELIKLKEAAVKGEGPTRMAEKREIVDNRKEQEEVERERLEREAVTFERFFKDTYLPQSKADKKPRTAQREEGFFDNWFKSILGNLPMKVITAFNLEMVKKEMANKKQSNRSIEYGLAVIRQVFHAAKRLGMYESESPTSNVRKPKVDNGRMRFLTQDEADKLLEALKAKSADVHDMTILSLHAGLRFGEIASLTWQDIDLTKGVLTIRDAKAGSRYAFLTPQAADMLRNRDQGKPSDYVFQKRGGGKLTKISHTFFRAVDDLKFNDGIDDRRLQICFHSCRHSYASWMIEQGTDLYTVQKLLGHKTNIMTQRYAHLAENKLKDAATALGAALAKRSTGQDQAGQVVNFQK